jgi:hypothetical protein
VALDLIGVSWPNIDEDDYREMAQAMREFADDIDDGAAEAHKAVTELIGANEGLAIQALEKHWGKVKDTHLQNLAEAGRMAATALDGVAVLIEGAKLAAIVQLGILAAETAAAVAASPVTLGLSALGGLAATQATRIAVKKIFQEICERVAEEVVNVAMGPVHQALGPMTGDLVVQLGGNALGVQDGVDLGRTAQAGRAGLTRSVDAAQSSMRLNSTGGDGVDSGQFSHDPDSFDRADSPQDASAAYAELERSLRAIDPQAFEGRENWWPLVLDDIRDTASTEWFTAFEIVDDRGEKQILTQAGGSAVHPEERLWARLRAAGVRPEQVLRIHTELEACFMPGHYCAMWLGQVFPDAQLTHNLPYGETAESRAEGIRQLREAADQAPR